ncbi:MAG: 50S ribosomal protein L11 methyltransferase [Planctomycetota bacterium]|nr:50S ribosomal protein L11 methyltransferase [Planctomycetota bacterium]
MSTIPAWTEVRVLAPIGWHELVAETLQDGPCTSVAFGRPSLGVAAAPEGFEYVRTFLPRRDDTPANRERIVAALRSLADSTGETALGDLAVEFKPLPPEDYATSWMKVWKPFRVGNLCVLSPWTRSATRPGDVTMVLEPGASFGSGRHATTRMMLRAIQDHLIPGERVVDCGTGSGILAVAAAQFGAREVVAFDIDPNAEPNARDLAERNGYGATCRFSTGGFELLPVRERPFDALLANIYSDVLQLHAADFRSCLRPGGWFALSGCPAQHAEATDHALTSAGLTITERPVRGRWHSFVGRRGS